MKKLMIAAAAAAMISGAYADVYTFSASLKTTTGKMGKATKQTIKAGKDALGANVWWRDVEFLGADGVTTGKYAKVISAGSAKKPATIKQADFDALTKAEQVEVLGRLALYPNVRAGDCLTLKVTNEAGCYRTTGTRKWEGYIWGADMCPGCNDDLYLDIYEKKSDAGYLGGAPFAPALFNVFGATTAQKSTKCEIADIAAIFPDVAFAGQGSGKWVDKDATGAAVTPYFRPTSVSGNIVAAIAAPNCEFCCDIDQVAIAFNCDGTAGDLATDGTEGTAAYGTWSMKYNAKLDKDYLDNNNIPQPKWF